jgi:hypothetical protein
MTISIAYIPLRSSSSGSPDKNARSEQPKEASKGPSAARFFDEIPKIAVTSRPTRSAPRSMDVDEPSRNPELDSFEAVMAAMERELERLKAEPKTPISETTSKATESRADVKGKGKAKDTPASRLKLSAFEDGDEGEDEEILDLQRSMDAELRSSLKRDMEVVSSDEDGGDSEEEVPMDYNLIKNFLESFKSQQGLTGPVQGLAGRLQGSDWALPRDG